MNQSMTLNMYLFVKEKQEIPFDQKESLENLKNIFYNLGPVPRKT